MWITTRSHCLSTFISEKIKKLIVMNNDGLNEAFLPHQKRVQSSKSLEIFEDEEEATMFQKIHAACRLENIMSIAGGDNTFLFNFPYMF